MADPTGSAPRSDRRITAIDWAIIALGLGLALLLLVGGLLPARERDREIRDKNERIADEVLDIKRDLQRRRERTDDRRLDPHVIERELRKQGGTREDEILLQPERDEHSPNAMNTGRTP